RLTCRVGRCAWTSGATAEAGLVLDIRAQRVATGARSLGAGARVPRARRHARCCDRRVVGDGASPSLCYQSAQAGSRLRACGRESDKAQPLAVVAADVAFSYEVQ